MKNKISSIKGLDDFLKSNPLMSLVPITDNGCVILRGTFYIHNTYLGEHEVNDSYELSIEIPETYPLDPPIVKETKEKIPKIDEFHVNSDGTLCLGSPLRLQLTLSKSSDINSFLDEYLTNFLYATSLKQSHGIDYIFGELDHGRPGEIEDYKKILKVSSESDVKVVFELLLLNKRVANKKLCPCGCSKRLGKCKYHKKINRLRESISKRQIRDICKRLFNI